jgi:peptidoglycan hydrolase-like protein with peptidoglycan-binding domain
MRLWPPSMPALWAVLLALLVAGNARAAGSADTAALQVALRERSLYVGEVDGLYGPLTSRAVRRLQHRTGLPVTGTVGPLTRHVLGSYARRTLGSRPMRFGA